MIFKNVYHKLWKMNSEHSKKSIIDIDSVFSVRNLKYGVDEKNNLCDIHLPASSFNKKLPTIIVIHGGGYISGKKEDNDGYSQILASNGFCVVNMEYTKCDGSEQKYFINQVSEVFDLFDYLSKNERLNKHIDFDNIFLAGDSAGSHIASMVANIQTNPALNNIFNLSGGPTIKGLIFVSPMFGPYKIIIPAKKQFESVVYGKNLNKQQKNGCYTFSGMSKHFPPSIMLSFKNDVLVKFHQKAFIRKAKKLNLSVEHCNVLKGYKIFHDVITKYPDCYPTCFEKITNFVNKRVKNECLVGINEYKIIEEELKPELKSDSFEKNK